MDEKVFKVEGIRIVMRPKTLSLAKTICVVVLSWLLLPGCAIKRPSTDFSVFEDNSGPNSSPVQNGNENQLEFPTTPGAAATPAEGVGVKRPGITLVLGGAGVASFATVGLLKRLKTEGIKIDMIVASGWPAVFALGYGFLKSVHDLEWFAMRLQEQDFSKACKIKEDEKKGTLSKLIESFLKREDLRDSKIPVVIVAGNSEKEDLGIFDSGDWREALLLTLPLPGLYRPFPKLESSSRSSFDLIGLGVREAQKRTNSKVFAVQMYSDYIEFFKASKSDGKKETIRSIYLASLRKSLKEEGAAADASYSIQIGGSPLDYSQKRSAILAGSSVAGKIIKNIVN